MFVYRPRLTSMGHAWIDWSTTSGNGVMKSDDKISGLKKISGPRKRSYPTSHEKLFPCLVVPLYSRMYLSRYHFEKGERERERERGGGGVLCGWSQGRGCDGKQRCARKGK